MLRQNMYQNVLYKLLCKDLNGVNRYTEKRQKTNK